jgi:IS5 family transposase
VSQPRDDRQNDLFGPSLEKIINLRHPLVRLAAEMDREFLAGRFGSVCRVGPGQPPLPTRLVAGLFILKHMHNLSDEALCDRWVENSRIFNISAAKWCSGTSCRSIARR